MPADLNENHLDPRLQQIVDILDNRKRHWFNQFMEVMNKLQEDFKDNPEQLDHAFQDIEYTIERRMVRK